MHVFIVGMIKNVNYAVAIWLVAVNPDYLTFTFFGNDCDSQKLHCEIIYKHGTLGARKTEVTSVTVQLNSNLTLARVSLAETQHILKYTHM